MNEILKKIDEEIAYHKRKSEHAIDRLEQCRHRSRMHEAKKIKGFILSEQNEPCEYILTDNDYNTWECNKCGELWILEAGTPQDNNMNYCPRCGRILNWSDEDK